MLSNPLIVWLNQQREGNFEDVTKRRAQAPIMSESLDTDRTIEMMSTNTFPSQPHNLPRLKLNCTWTFERIYLVVSSNGHIIFCRTYLPGSWSGDLVKWGFRALLAFLWLFLGPLLVSRHRTKRNSDGFGKPHTHTPNTQDTHAKRISWSQP